MEGNSRTDKELLDTFVDLLSVFESPTLAGKNISEAITLAVKLKKDSEVGSPRHHVVRQYISIGKAEEAISDLVEKAVLLYQDEDNEPTINIYSGYYRNSNTSETAVGIELHIDNTVVLSLKTLYAPLSSLKEVELRSIAVSLRIASLNLQHIASTINIYSFASYPIDAISVWSFTWKKNGWRKSGGAIKNLKQIQDAHDLYTKISKRVKFMHVDIKDESLENEATKAILYRCKYLGENAVENKISFGEISSNLLKD